jgi:hypothetical protein
MPRGLLGECAVAQLSGTYDGDVPGWSDQFPSSFRLSRLGWDTHWGGTRRSAQASAFLDDKGPSNENNFKHPPGWSQLDIDRDKEPPPPIDVGKKRDEAPQLPGSGGAQKTPKEERDNREEEARGTMVKPKNYTGWIGQMKPDGHGRSARPVPPNLRPPNKPECNFLVFSRGCGWRDDSDFKNFAGDTSLANKIPNRKDLWVPAGPEDFDGKLVPPRDIRKGEWMGKDGPLIYRDEEEELDANMKLLDEVGENQFVAEMQAKAPRIGVPREPVYDPENPNLRDDAVAQGESDSKEEAAEGIPSGATLRDATR